MVRGSEERNNSGAPVDRPKPTARTATTAGSRATSRALSRRWCYTRATMIRDSAPIRVFRINELSKLIAGQLVLLSRASTTNLACACRYLEEPALSTLWETQLFLQPLLEVLPEGTWDRGRPMRRVVCCLNFIGGIERLNMWLS